MFLFFEVEIETVIYQLSLPRFMHFSSRSIDTYESLKSNHST
jgi:hypothetical protein